MVLGLEVQKESRLMNGFSALHFISAGWIIVRINFSLVFPSLLNCYFSITASFKDAFVCMTQSCNRNIY